MTNTTMKPGRELDALVATKVMGWDCDVRWMEITDYNPKTRIGHAIDAAGVEKGGVCDERSTVRPVPHYSTDIAAAWQVVDKFEAATLDRSKQRPSGKHEDYFSCQFWEGGNWIEAEGESIEHAICLAALEACE